MIELTLITRVAPGFLAAAWRRRENQGRHHRRDRYAILLASQRCEQRL
ncbi:MAG: hypothetical protein AVDCRST_MAG18-12 [uncultured Thermomicrobiales bacterium]|uniref:Uncharacterized protein n=1 Tax=uncultured Thermomicrobiales bacterium TaxID=1645740 RepID=A0A6J4UDR9_9BACT|nr:MAG: hypothetical protein AVDCRST_MAG18-12 [uncultured Thermomicrobiales bacterium]